jgi:hypothetical protein
MHCVIKPAALVAGFLIVSVAAPAHAVFYMFTNVADTTTAAPTGTFQSFDIPAIDGATVAFTGTYSGFRGVFTGNGGAVSTIAKTGDVAPSGTFISVSPPSISGGVVAFQASYGASQFGVFIGSGGPLTTIAKSGDAAPLGTFSGFAGPPGISGSNVVARGTYLSGAGVFVGTGGPLTTIQSTGSLGLPSISGNLVAFNAAISGGSAVFTGSGGTLNLIVKTGDSAPVGTFSNFGFPSISGTTAAFLGFYNGSANRGVFTGNGGSLTAIIKTGDAAPSGTFSSFGDPSISGGTVAFRGNYGSNTGIFTGNGGPVSAVIKTGDPLFGSTVSFLDFDRFGLDANGGGNLAFRYYLSDGRNGVAIASAVVPETSTMVIWSVITLGAMVYAAWQRNLQLSTVFSPLRIAVSVGVMVFAIFGGYAHSAVVIVPFDTPGSVAAQTASVGISTFVSNSFATTQGISGLFTGNPSAPIGPPSALSLGATPGPATYFHFSPLPGYRINSIGISATGAFTGQSTTFRVFAANENLSSIQYDSVMTPTGPGVAGLNGGAVFLSANSLPPGSPITAFRVWQLDDGFGVLDNLVADVSFVPEASAFWVWASIVGLAAWICAARPWCTKRTCH